MFAKNNDQNIDFTTTFIRYFVAIFGFSAAFPEI